MEDNYWRRRAKQAIAQVIERVGRDDPKALDDALVKAYPFGERKHWPYKIWLDECRRVRRELFGGEIPKPGSPERGPLLDLMEE